jgi:hypothetical protein
MENSDRFSKILGRLDQDIKSFDKLDVKTEIKNKDTIIAVYETIYEINESITEVFPETIDPVVMARHNELVDKAIDQRNQILVDLVKIIAEIAKFPLPI